MHLDNKEYPKYDAHVRTAFKHFFPKRLFLVLSLFVFILGFLFGNAYGYFSCQTFMSLIYKLKYLNLILDCENLTTSAYNHWCK
jgi:hypothetical protein